MSHDDSNDDVEKGPGGSGGTLERGRANTKLLERALRAGWPVRPELRAKVLDRLEAVIDDPQASHRETTSASKALMDATRLELAAIETAIRAEQHEEIAERVREIEARLKEQGDQP
jgi:hypothetical protein